MVKEFTFAGSASLSSPRASFRSRTAVDGSPVYVSALNYGNKLLNVQNWVQSRQSSRLAHFRCRTQDRRPPLGGLFAQETKAVQHLSVGHDDQSGRPAFGTVGSPAPVRHREHVARSPTVHCFADPAFPSPLDDHTDGVRGRPGSPRLAVGRQFERICIERRDHATAVDRIGVAELARAIRTLRCRRQRRDHVFPRVSHARRVGRSRPVRHRHDSAACEGGVGKRRDAVRVCACRPVLAEHRVQRSDKRHVEDVDPDDARRAVVLMAVPRPVGGPLVLGTLQDKQGNDVIALRHRNLTPNQFDILGEEETSADPEVLHSTNPLGWVVISNP